MDDNSNNRSLQKLIQKIWKKQNTEKVPPSVNSSSAKETHPMSTITLPRTDAISTTSHTTSSSSEIKRKHPPLTKKIENNLLKRNRFMQTKRSEKRLIREILIKLQWLLTRRQKCDQGKEYLSVAEFTIIIVSKHILTLATTTTLRYVIQGMIG